MALVKCGECGNEISNKAQACPKCGAKPPKTPVFLYFIGGIAGLFVIFIGIGLLAPSGGARSHDRQVIEICWQDHERKSLTGAEKRFIAGTCEMLEKEFQTKHNARP